MSPREKEFTERINVFFTPEQMEQVKHEASNVGLTVSAYVRMIVMNKINKETGALKLTHEATLFKSFTCPRCKNVIRDVTNKEDEFDCPYCGQRLKK